MGSGVLKNYQQPVGHIPTTQAEVLRQTASITGVPLTSLLQLPEGQSLTGWFDQRYGHNIGGQYVFENQADVVRVAAAILRRDTSEIVELAEQHIAANNPGSRHGGPDLDISCLPHATVTNDCLPSDEHSIHSATYTAAPKLTTRNLRSSSPASSQGSLGESARAQARPGATRAGTTSDVRGLTRPSIRGVGRTSSGSATGQHMARNGNTIECGSIVAPAQSRIGIRLVASDMAEQPDCAKLHDAHTRGQPASWIKVTGHKRTTNQVADETNLLQVKRQRTQTPEIAAAAATLGPQVACAWCALNHEACEAVPGSHLCRKCFRRGLKASSDRECLNPRKHLKDITLHRTNSTLKKWKRLPFTGKGAGTLGIVPAANWHSTPREVSMTQRHQDEHGNFLSVTFYVYRFDLPDDLNEEERHMLSVPWGLKGLSDALKQVQEYLELSATALAAVLRNHSPVTKEIFKFANDLAVHNQSDLCKDALRFFLAARAIETHWDGFDRALDSDGRTYLTLIRDWEAADYQLACLVMSLILQPIRQRILSRLMLIMKRHRKKKWHEIFLIFYILLHSIELVIQQQTRFARTRRSQFRWTNMTLIENLHEAAYHILAFFSVCCAGTDPLAINDRDWISGNLPYGELSLEARSMMQRVCRQMKDKASDMHRITSDGYEEPGYLTGRLFSTSWASFV